MWCNAEYREVWCAGRPGFTRQRPEVRYLSRPPGNRRSGPAERRACRMLALLRIRSLSAGPFLSRRTRKSLAGFLWGKDRRENIGAAALGARRRDLLLVVCWQLVRTDPATLRNTSRTRRHRGADPTRSSALEGGTAQEDHLWPGGS